MVAGHKRSKRHHFVAQSIQRRFYDKSIDKIWYSEKTETGFSEIEARTSYGCFWASNLNTTLVEDKPDDPLERGHWKTIDDYFDVFLKEVDQAFDHSKPLLLVDGRLDAFKEHFIYLAKRSPDSTDLPSADEMGEVYQAKIKAYAKQNGLDLLGKYDDPIWLRQNGRAILAESKASYSELVVKSLEDYSMCWAVPRGNSSFLLGSRNVYRAGNKSSGHLDDPNTELFWPVSPKLALVLVRLPTSDFPRIGLLDQAIVRGWNEEIRNSSQSVASHSSQLLKSLLSQR